MLRCYLGDDFRWVTPGGEVPMPPSGSLSGGRVEVQWIPYTFELFWPKELRGSGDEVGDSDGRGSGVGLRGAKRLRQV